MPSVSLHPTTTANDLSIGSLSWTRADGDVEALDAAEADVAVGSTVQSHILKCTTLGAPIPVDATIDGVIVSIVRRASNGGMEAAIKDASLRLFKAGYAAGDDKADLATAWPTTEDVASYGGDADLWGLTLTPADVNDTGFGVGISVAGDGGIMPGTAYVNYITITVYYTEASPPAAGDELDEQPPPGRRIRRRSAIKRPQPVDWSLEDDDPPVGDEDGPPDEFARARRRPKRRRLAAPTDASLLSEIVATEDSEEYEPDEPPRRRRPKRRRRTLLQEHDLATGSTSCDCPPGGAVIVSSGFAAALVEGDAEQPRFAGFAVVRQPTGFAAVIRTDCDC